jgi:hypothetical protein
MKLIESSGRSGRWKLPDARRDGHVQYSTEVQMEHPDSGRDYIGRGENHDPVRNGFPRSCDWFGKYCPFPVMNLFGI